jgi:hypothetical protein
MRALVSRVASPVFSRSPQAACWRPAGRLRLTRTGRGGDCVDLTGHPPLRFGHRGSYLPTTALRGLRERGRCGEAHPDIESA